MTDPEGQIPLGNGFYLDTAAFTSGFYGASHKSDVAEQCFELCDPNEIVAFCGNQAVAQACMRNAMHGGGPQETIVEVEIQCKGPKRKLLGGKKCGAKVKLHEVAKPLDLHAETEGGVPTDTIEVPEVMEGVTWASLVTDCMTNPERSMEDDEGVLWTDKVLDLPGISPSNHISVGSRDGVAIHIDINNQSSNPFTPARIECDLSGKHGQLELKHNDVADEGGAVEYFAVEDRAELDARATELFKRYFVRY